MELWFCGSYQLTMFCSAMQKQYLTSVGVYYKYLSTLFFRAESSSSKKKLGIKSSSSSSKNFIGAKSSSSSSKNSGWSSQLTDEWLGVRRATDGQAWFVFGAGAGAFSSKLIFWSWSWSFWLQTIFWELELELLAPIEIFGAGAGAFDSELFFGAGAFSSKNQSAEIFVIHTHWS